MHPPLTPLAAYVAANVPADAWTQADERLIHQHPWRRLRLVVEEAPRWNEAGATAADGLARHEALKELGVFDGAVDAAEFAHALFEALSWHACPAELEELVSLIQGYLAERASHRVAS